MNVRIQEIYKNRSASSAKPSVGNIVIVMHEASKAFKRGRVADYNSTLNKYKIDLIDYGNRIICTQKHIYEIEKSLTALPPLAIRCSFINVIRNKSREEIQSQLTKYISDGKTVRCLFACQEGDFTLVELKLGEKDIKDAMVKDGLILDIPKGDFILLSIILLFLTIEQSQV